MRKGLLSGGLALAILAGPAFAGPFGVDAGASPSKYGGKLDSGVIYRIDRLPAPHPEFESLLVIAPPELGICKIAASGKTRDGDVFGEAVKDSFNRIRDQLSSKYGQPEQFDQLRSGSIWDDPQDYMMSLYKEERSLIAFWDGDDLGDGISSIALEANALSSSRFYLSLRYEFGDAKKCVGAARSVGANVL